MTLAQILVGTEHGTKHNLHTLGTVLLGSELSGVMRNTVLARHEQHGGRAMQARVARIMTSATLQDMVGQALLS